MACEQGVLDRDTSVPLDDSAFAGGALDPELLEAVAATIRDLGGLVDSRIAV